MISGCLCMADPSFLPGLFPIHGGENTFFPPVGEARNRGLIFGQAPYRKPGGLERRSACFLRTGPKGPLHLRYGNKGGMP